ncbi:MAG: NAD-dependent deacylase [Phycisphaerales bacterium]|nr:MAG: NAD-dependent deacylase [Phycisphaerales bacterium]
MNEIEHLADLLSSARAGIAFTGAGISTESGIPDFRSPGGVWSKHKPVRYDDFVALRSERVRYWEMRQQMYREYATAKPNDGHKAIARLEEMGHLVAVVTQNIDGLHQEAGSRHVLEVHGSDRMVACIACGKEWTPPEVLARVEAGDDAPDCDECGAPLKSKTISFGQAMPQDVMAEAMQLSCEADVYMSLGSSLVVEPAASLPRMAKHNGATLVIINKTETPLDGMADLIIREPIGETMRAVMQRCDG